MLYTVAVPELLFATHSGLVGPSARPHGFCELGSTTWAPWSLRFEIRLVWWNSFPPPRDIAVAPEAAVATATAAGTATANAPRANDRGLKNLDDMCVVFLSAPLPGLS